MVRRRAVQWLTSGTACALLVVGVALGASRFHAPAPSTSEPLRALAPEPVNPSEPAICSSAERRAAQRAAAQGSADPRMQSIPQGSYLPFYKGKTALQPVAVKAFSLDSAPVAAEEFLHFVCKRPEWRKSGVKALFAEYAYLADWKSDLDPGEDAGERPATFVSWFAARAYCQWLGKRLPTLVEWERVAGALGAAEPPSGTASAKSLGTAPFRFAMGRVAPDLASSELVFGRVWEWTLDFNSVEVTGRPDGADGPGNSLFCGDGFRATDATNYGAFLRYSFRSSLKANYALKNLGFRCAKN